MPGTELRGPAARTRIGPQRGQLRSAADRLPGSLHRRHRRPRRVDRGGRRAHCPVWATHGRSTSSFTEGPDGLFEELLDDSVEVAPEVDRLRRDHEVLVAAMARARELLASPTAGPDDTKLLTRSPASPSRSTSTGGGAPTCCTRSTASTSRLATDQPLRTNPGLRPGHRPNCRGAGLPVLLVRRHVRLHAHERHPRRRRGAGRAGRVPGHRARALARPRHPGGEVAGRRLHVRGHRGAPGRRDRARPHRAHGERRASCCRCASASPPARVIVFEGDDFIGMSINLASRLLRRRRARGDPRQRRGGAGARRRVPRHPARRAPDPRHRDAHPGVADRRARDGGRRSR